MEMDTLRTFAEASLAFLDSAKMSFSKSVNMQSR